MGGQEEEGDLRINGSRASGPTAKATTLYVSLKLWLVKIHFGAELWWCTPLIPALGRQRQVDLCEFKASLVYKS